MFKLLASAFKRLTTAMTAPFQTLWVKIQRMFNVNVITAKLVAPLTKKIKSLIVLRPDSWKDYYKFGRLYVYKKLFLLLVVGTCAIVFIVCKNYLPQVERAEAEEAVVTDITYDYDDMDLQKFTGTANIRAADGKVCYTGDIANGMAAGNGILYDRKGRLVYNGAFLNNEYSGAGTEYYPSGKIKYSGEFLSNRYGGEGKFYDEDGGLVYSGAFADGLYSGAGQEYDGQGVMIYDGGFLAGLYHGAGVSYYGSGLVKYQGEFFQGLPQGAGSLYSASGKLIYAGSMYHGEINYASLVHATLADIETMFAETPVIYYCGNECVYVYSEAKTALALNCSVKMYERDNTAPGTDDSSSYFFLPGETYEAYSGQEPIGEPVEIGRLSAGAFDLAAMYRLLGSSSKEGPISGLASANSGWAAVPLDTAVIGESSSGQTAEPGSSQEQSSESSLPDFVEKTFVLYYEVDSGVWQSEDELDKTLVQVSSVVAFGGAEPSIPADAKAYGNTEAPSLSDCVAIEMIRAGKPTAFSNITYEADRQMRLRVEVSSINYAGLIVREEYVADELTYLKCYQFGDAETLMYFIIR
ncbi:MAG TPA: hypothetical protein PLP20_03165 [Oscillospiraceae bacterium]|nr:hypothetical protein [Oscillospiraceae bacterium]HNW03958.1 hypothetical protein [Oscillospiraceae bacterium]HPW00038.1 hypothetical protein [Oscillospiraceae bacterium]